MRSRVMLHWLAGTLGGILAWILVEPIPWLTTDPRPGQPVVPVTVIQTLIFGLLIGLPVGGLIGAAYGAGSSARTRRFLLIGALTGAVGGSIGLLAGQSLYGVMTGPANRMGDNSLLGPLGFLLVMLARSAGWACIGFGLGILQGVINGSVQRSRNGAIGGLIGGGLGGFIFQLLNSVANIGVDASGRGLGFMLSGELLRLIGLTITGSAIGLFVGLTERAFRQAWVRVRAGRNEGAEFVLDKPVNTIGRDELSDVPLFGDLAIALKHATIQNERGGYIFTALQAGAFVNNLTASRVPLNDGDVIRIGAKEIEFHQKGAPRSVGAVSSTPGIAPAPIVPEGVCVYCGQTRNAQGQCACSPGAAPIPAPVAATLTPPPNAPSLGAGLLRLVGMAGPYDGRTFPLDKPLMIVGREDSSDIVLGQDGMVSRRHARLVVQPERIEIVDEGSSNGTYVNGARIGQTRLKPGDEITLGASRFRLEGV